MKTFLASTKERGYEWIDILSPNKEELEEIALTYHLHNASVIDALQADHLPKFERFNDHTFSILRVFTAEKNGLADTVQELTDKVAIFTADSFIITIHKNEWPPLRTIVTRYVETGKCNNPVSVLNEIVKAALISYDQPAGKLTQLLEYYEEHIFLKDRKVPLLKGLYFLKRKVDVIQRILLLSYDIIDNIDPAENSNPHTRDIRDLYVKQQSIFDSLAANMNHLLTIYFNVSAQKTNETIRILTIFSVFFMPLTFIVGIYGMNFDVMPELRWRWGYPAAMIFMVVVVISIYSWFKRKKWL